MIESCHCGVSKRLDGGRTQVPASVPLALGVMAIVSRLGPVRQSYQIDGGGFAWFCGGPRLLSGAGVYFVGNSATS